MKKLTKNKIKLKKLTSIIIFGIFYSREGLIGQAKNKIGNKKGWGPQDGNQLRGRWGVGLVKQDTAVGDKKANVVREEL